MGKLRRLAGETVLYGLGTFIPRMMNFLLVPLHTKIFNPEDYGTITELYAYVAFLNILYTFGMETTYFRFATKPGADATQVFNVCQSIVLGISILLSVLFIGFSSQLAAGVGLAVERKYVVWLTVIMFIDAAVAIPFARLRLEKKARTFAFARVVNVLILIGLNAYFLLVAYNPSIGVAYVFIANLAANLFYVLFFYRFFLQWRPTLEKQMMVEMSRYAYPIMLTGLAGMTNEMFSRLTLEWWLPKGFYAGRNSEYALGVFGACYKFAVFMSLTIQAFRFAAEPFFFSSALEKNSPRLFAQVNHYFIVVCCIILLGVSINLDLLKFLLGSKAYWEGLVIVPLLLCGYLFLGVYYNLSVWFKLTDQTHYGTFLTAGGAAVTILLNFVLVPRAGYLGSAMATLGCYFLMAAGCYLTGAHRYPIPYRVARGLLYIFGTMILIYAVNTIKIEGLLISTGFHGLILIAFTAVAFLFERKELRLTASNDQQAAPGEK